MKQHAKQRHFMSSKDLYFLPNITSIRPAHSKKRMQTGSHSSVQRMKSIQQIMLNKSILEFRTENSVSQIVKCKKSNNSNLYDKYDYFPKIFALKNVRKNQTDKCKTEQFPEQTEQNLHTNNEVKPKCQNDTPHNKENNFNFNSVYFRQDFNRRLEQEIGKLQFTIKYSFSHNNMLIAEDTVNDEQQTPKEREPLKKKYTKLQTCAKEQTKNMTELQKVPSFLLKLIETKKH